MNNIYFATILKEFSNVRPSCIYAMGHENKLLQLKISDIGKIDGTIFFHDSTLLVDEFIGSGNALPNNIGDIGLLINTIETKENKESSEKNRDIVRLFGTLPAEGEVLISKYIKAFWGDDTSRSNHEALTPAIHYFLQAAREQLLRYLSNPYFSLAIQRYFDIEQKIFFIFSELSVKGISYDKHAVKLKRSKLESELYSSIKELSDRSSLPLVIPNSNDKLKVLKEQTQGINFSSDSSNQINLQIKLLAETNTTIGLLHKTIKASTNLYIFKKIPSAQNTLNPIFDTMGTTTGRILCKDPELQNISKIHRNIITAECDSTFLYADYEQFEAGILASVSGCDELVGLYNQGDIYETLAIDVYGDPSNRKFAKRLFLSYIYGMKEKTLCRVSEAKQRGSKKRLTSFLEKFISIEKWKDDVYKGVIETGFVDNGFGGVRRFSVKNGALSEKQQRAVISQKIQGTASHIFKMAILEFYENVGHRGRIVLPMHDALLVSAKKRYSKEVFEILTSSMEKPLRSICPDLKPKVSKAQFFTI